MDNLNIRVKAEPSNQLSARIGSQNAIKVVSSLTQETLKNELRELEDISLPQNVEDGSILAYNATTMKWEATTELDGGSY